MPGSAVASFGAETWLPALFGLIPVPTQYWIALAADEPGDQSDGDSLADLEPDPAAGYARQSYGIGTGNWAADGAFLSNAVQVDFGVPTDTWGPVSHFVLCDAAVSGDLYGWGELVTPLNILAGAPVLIPAGAMVVTMSSLLSSIAI